MIRPLCVSNFNTGDERVNYAKAGTIYGDAIDFDFAFQKVQEVLQDSCGLGMH